jgi:small subunit ribosomal protein S1
MSWTRHVRHPSKVVAIGDIIEAIVLAVDKENEKISLGLKQVEPDPWLTIAERYPVGSRVSGKVRNLTNFGAFVELEEGIDGLVHISDLSWTTRVNHPSEILKKSDKVDVVVLSVDPERRRISLGLKQVQEDPWPALAEDYAEGTLHTGKIKRLLEKGVVVEIGPNVEGFVPLSQLGIENMKTPSEAFSEGEEIPLRVARFDLEHRRVVLSVKGYMDQQEAAVFQEYLDKHPVTPITIESLAGEEVAEKARESVAEGSGEAETKQGRSESDDTMPVETPAEDTGKDSPADSPEAEQAATDSPEPVEKTEVAPEAGEAEEAPEKREETGPGAEEQSTASEGDVPSDEPKEG